MITALAEALSRAEAHAPYLRRLMTRFPETRDALAAGQLEAALRVAIDPALETGIALRHAKARLALALAIGDLAGLLSLEQVVGALSDFADDALDHAVRAAIEACTPGANPRGFAVIALGKHGSRELNYSSDLDPILIFDPLTLPHRARDEPIEGAVRVARKLVEIMQARTGDGYVFRIDLRLRPSPEATPIALPVDAAISYYESAALAWERAAFIRARACAGDVALGTGFLEAIRPFVWRRGLDFGAIREVRTISARIRDHYAQGQAFGPGYDLKRGRGGIRECEFFAQIHQLIHGGRNPALRLPATLPALAALAGGGWIARDQANQLAASYRLYRTIEHRLQMVDDQQTHQLPASPEALDNVAQLSGYANGAALLETLAPHVAAVGTIYDALDGEASDSLPNDTARLELTLREQGLGDAAGQLALRIEDWRSGRIRAIRTPAAHAAFEAVLPALIGALAEAPDHVGAIRELDRLIERLPSAVNLFRLLEARAPLLKLLTDILCYAPTLADALGRRVELLDGLIDASALDPVDDVAALIARLTPEDPAADLEHRLDHVRRLVGEIRFALGTQIIVGASDPLDVAAGYARLAEAAVVCVAKATITEFERAHGRVPASEMLILALGRLGGGELTHASDLDLVFLFTGDFSAESQGPKPLGASLYFNRLAQRISAGLSVPTAAGPLYEVDTRLRPSGHQGPIAVSLESFARYQAEDAWTWEHMALARARAVFGSGAARAAVTKIIAQTLCTQRDPAKIVADAVQMRTDMATHKPPKSALDVKLAPGGLVDLEFTVHVLQLTEARGLDPHLGRAIHELGLPAELGAAQALMTRMLVVLRLVAPDLATPAAPTRRLVARACAMRDWESLIAALDAARTIVSRHWQLLSGPAKGELP